MFSRLNRSILNEEFLNICVFERDGARKCIWIDILTYTVPRFDNTVEIGEYKRSSSTQGSLKHYTTGLAKSSTSMLNKGDAIVNVKIDVTTQRLEEEYEIFHLSVVGDW